MSKQTKLTFKHHKGKKSKKRQTKAKTATKKPSNYNVAPPVPTGNDSSAVTAEELQAIRDMEIEHKYKPQIRGVIRSWTNDNTPDSNQRLKQHFEQELSIMYMQHHQHIKLCINLFICVY